MVLYCCHRSRCSRSGRIASSGGYVVGGNEESPKKEPRVYKGTTGPVGEGNRAYLLERFGLGDGDLSRAGVLEDQSTGAVVFRITGPYGENRGVCLRRFEPKWNDIYRDDSAEGQPLYGYIRAERCVEAQCVEGGPMVLVEDPWSGIKVSRQFTAVVLFGTHLSLDGLLEVVKQTDQIVLALDRDAYDKAVGFKKRYAYLAPYMRVVRLDRDLKYESNETIKAIIKGEGA